MLPKTLRRRLRERRMTKNDANVLGQLFNILLQLE
jgi:hypothetical protein